MIFWVIEKLSAILSDTEIVARQADSPVVVRVHWRVTAQDGTVTGNVSGQQEFTYDPAAEFTPYDQLTEAQVLTWVHAAMGDQRKAYEDMVLQQVEQRKAEPITLPLPWHQPKSVIVEPPSSNDALLGGNGNDTLGGLV
tara:strand:+ start:272 stop:688 length:417 start_codon:yes stop_codon:yes gene_type:complete